MPKPTMGSLFAGFGGFDKGFEDAGFETVWQVENDSYCQRVLAKNFPSAKRFGDITTVDARALGPTDVICAGFPCQDISYAGIGAGITGSRSGLVTHAIRIIDELEPRAVLLENVAALLRRGLREVLGMLTDIGYDAEWEIVSALDVIETDHLRKRLFVLAYPNRDRCAKRNYDASYGYEAHECKQARSENLGETVEIEIADPKRRNFALGPENGRAKWVHQPIPRNGNWQITHKPTLDGTENGIPNRLERLRGLGNAVVPQIPEMYARRIMESLNA